MSKENLREAIIETEEVEIEIDMITEKAHEDMNIPAEVTAEETIPEEIIPEELMRVRYLTFSIK